MEVEDASHASGWGIERDPNASNPIATIPTDRHAQCAEGDRSTQSATLLVPKAEEANSAAHSSSSLGPCCGVVAIIALLLVCAYCYTVAHQKTWSWQGEMLRENLLGTEVQNRVDHQARPRFLKFDNPPNDACMRQIFSHNGTSTKGNKWRELCSLRIFFVGGAHHSGTGLLRQLIVEFPLMKKHSGTNFPQDEGMFLQSVFPPVRSRDESFCGPCTPPGPTCVITCPALRRSYVTNENREILFHDWVERWGVLPSSGGSGLLVEKTPDFTMAFRTAMFPHVSVPVMIMRHPACSYAREEHIRDENDWGAVWADFLLEQMDNFVSRAALVRFEDIVTQGKDRVQENLWRVLGLTSSNKGEGEDRRLHLHSKVTSNTERLLWGEGHCPSFDEASLSAETRHLATLFGYGFEDSTHYLSRPSWLLPDGTNIVATKKDIIFIGDELRRFRQDQLARSSGEIVPTALLGGLLNDGLLPWNGDTIDGLRVENGMIAAYPNDPVPINRMLRELPSCDTVLRSSLSSVRCGAMGSHTWPVLVTGTPRSGTSSTQTALEHLGVKVSRDMFSPLSDGTVSWMLAFYDDTPFGHSRPKGGRFMAGIHQVRDPLGAIASMCTEPISRRHYYDFLSRHIPQMSLLSPHPNRSERARQMLMFWVEWNNHLDKLGLYVVQKEDNQHLQRIFAHFSGVLDQRIPSEAEISSALSASRENSRKHRMHFTWEELLTIDEDLAQRAWAMAREYGYSYEGLESLEGLAKLPVVPAC